MLLNIGDVPNSGALPEARVAGVGDSDVGVPWEVPGALNHRQDVSEGLQLAPHARPYRGRFVVVQSDELVSGVEDTKGKPRQEARGSAVAKDGFHSATTKSPSTESCINAAFNLPVPGVGEAGTAVDWVHLDPQHVHGRLAEGPFMRLQSGGLERADTSVEGTVYQGRIEAHDAQVINIDIMLRSSIVR